MKRKENLPELLAPAGSTEALYAAVEAGADAVYLGISGGATNARVNAQNFTLDELRSAIPYAHGHGVKIYLTLNTLAYDGELSALLSLAKDAAAMGVDAFIVADLGLASLLSRELPEIPLHASTQAFAHSTATADALYSLGFERVVLARELSAENILSVTEGSLAETEVFIHGAMCVSHSGQCLFSSLVGGRSGNRGACAQPCRLPYGNGKYPLSLKDMCLATHIPTLINAGVASLKIEGRMKSPEYVYTVTKIYRRLLNERRSATEKELDTLRRAFSRSGFTDGYFTEHIDKNMQGVRTDADKEASRAGGERTFLPLPISVTAEVVFRRALPSRLTLSLALKNGDLLSVTAFGAVPENAENAALSESGVRERLSKMGATPFRLSSLSLELDEGVFLPVGAQNALRREAAETLLSALALHRKENAVHPAPLSESGELKPLKTAVFYRLAPYLKADVAEAFDAVFLPLEDCMHLKEHMPNGVLLPPVIPDSEEDEVEAMLYKAKSRGARYALASSLGAVMLAKKHGLIPVGDFRLNITNSESASILRALGVEHFILSPELSPARASRIGGGYIVYGRIPLMLTERCFIKESFGCEACGKASLTDRKGISFPVLRTHRHRCTVFNSLPTYVGDQAHVMRELSPLGFHFVFSTESAQEIKNVLTAFEEGLPLGNVRRAYK